MDSSLVEKKKKSKKEKSHEKEVTVDPVDKKRKVEEEVEALVEKEQKKEKKNKDKSKKEEPVPVSSVPEVTELPEDEKKRQKKDKKAAKKAKQEEPSSTPSRTTAASSSSIPNLSQYVEHPTVSSLTHDEANEYRQSIAIQILPEEEVDTFKPLQSFDYLEPSFGDLCPYVDAYVREKGFKKPSPIQSQCWPPLLSGRDLIGIAATGSGKTLAFLLPALLMIEKAKRDPRLVFSPSTSHSHSVPTPHVLILAPTRELAMQSQQVVVEMKGPKSVCIYGGVPKHVQKQELRGGAVIVVATPGRLMDLVEEGALKLDGVFYAVLDEADRMLDEGFAPAIKSILSQCPPCRPLSSPPGQLFQGSASSSSFPLVYRQTVMFSATWPEEIRQLASQFLSPEGVVGEGGRVRVVVGSEDLSANHQVTQIVECIDVNYQKRDARLLQLLDSYHASRTNRCLIFVLYKKEAVQLQQTLQRRGYNVGAIHGDKGQNERTSSLEDFRAGRVPLLIATDVAARGLDIPQVEHVLNYSFPLTVEDYVHRIGRTGRGGAKGQSHTFFTDNDKALAGALVGVLQEAGQSVPSEIYKYPMVTKKKESKLYGAFGPKPELAGKKATKITFD